MTKNRPRLGLIAIACLLTVGLAGYWLVTRDSPEEKNFKRVTVGMSVEEVEAILGPGTVMKQSEVMSYRVAVNPDEEAAFAERHRKAGTVPTARDYATRNRHVVEGDLIYHWESGYYETWIAFKDGKVCEKYLHNWNYL
jgi:hypothetical protein